MQLEIKKTTKNTPNQSIQMGKHQIIKIETRRKTAPPNFDLKFYENITKKINFIQHRV